MKPTHSVQNAKSCTPASWYIKVAFHKKTERKGKKRKVPKLYISNLDNYVFLFEENLDNYLYMQNWSGRAAPIKEQTVISYVLEAARDGCEVNWVRFCEEIGLSVDIASQIGTAISKVGARDRLKPIKEELPENVSDIKMNLFLKLICNKLLTIRCMTNLFLLETYYQLMFSLVLN